MGSEHTRTAIATGTCLTLGVALAVSLGVIPRATGSGGGLIHLASAASASNELLPSPVLRGAAHQAPAPSHSVTPAQVHRSAVTSTVAVVPATQRGVSHAVDAAAHIKASHRPATKPAAKKHHKKAHHKKAHKPAAPKLAARTTPSAGAVSNAIAGLKQYVSTPFSVTSSEVATFGNDVCSAFDKNETYNAVKAAILAKVQQLPFTTVKSGAADYVVRTAVNLYCPGYSSRLG